MTLHGRTLGGALPVALLLLPLFGCQMMGGAPAEASRDDPALRSVAWLAGAWEHVAADGAVIEEFWTAPRNGSMLGLSRTLADGAMREFEYLRIALHDGKVYYLAAPGGRHPPTRFELVDQSPSVLIFENARHDFPRRILYERSDDELRVRLEGEERGESRSIEWTYRFAKH